MATKSLVLRVRVTDVLMAALEEESSRLGVSVSKLVRGRLEGRSFADVDRDVERVMDGVARKFDDPLLPGGPARKSVEAQAMERVRAPRPSAVQVAKRSYDPDFK